MKRKKDERLMVEKLKRVQSYFVKLGVIEMF